MKSEPGWRLALERAAASRIALVIGATDSGKTSLTTFLASGLAERGFRVGVVDADLGQSQIGPPTTLGLGRVSRPIAALADAELLALRWVGGASPPGFERALAVGTRLLVDRALAFDLRPILVDTCGLVRGELGRFLKLEKIRRVDPDLVICLDHGGECDRVLAALAGHARPEVLGLPVGEAARRRSHEERRRHRESALEAYFLGARPRPVPLATLVAGSDGDEAAPGAPDLEDTLVGLHDEFEETLGLGRIASVDRPRGVLLVETPVRAPIATVSLGREKFRPLESAR